MQIDSIMHGIVIDHITAGHGLRLFELLALDELSCPVAIIKNVQSKKLGRKDIIKIDGCEDVNLDVVGFVDPDATVNVIKNGIITEKRSCRLPNELRNVVKCKNPRCITSTEQELEHIFKLTDRDKKTYRCIYCETKLSN